MVNEIFTFRKDVRRRIRTISVDQTWHLCLKNRIQLLTHPKTYRVLDNEKEMFYGLQFLFTKPHKRESTLLNLNSILLVYKILFNILYWNSLNLVFNVVLKGSRYISSQSSWHVCTLKTLLDFFCTVGILDILGTRFWKLTYFSSICKMKSVWNRSWVLEEIEFVFVLNTVER